MTTSRRRFLQGAVAVTAGFRGLRSLLADMPDLRNDFEAWTARGYGPLRPDPAKILDLPNGFSYRIISRAGQEMDDGLLVPGLPDGMGAFAGPNGRTVLVRNHEILATEPQLGPFGAQNQLLDRVPASLAYDRGRGTHPCLGGTTTLLYDTNTRQVERQYLSLACTQYNCAGGVTPWSTWITCEENVQRADDAFERDHGYAFEVPALADGKLTRPIPLRAMGRFRREAVCVEPKSGTVYQTEDREDGLIYRFLPNETGRLEKGGRLQALAVRGRPSVDVRNWLDEDGKLLHPNVPAGTRFDIEWIDMDHVESPNDDLRYRGFERGSARFARAEGMWYGRDAAYFACTEGGPKRKGQIWRYSPSPFEGTPSESERPGVLELFIEPRNPGLVDNADNLTVAPWGDLIVCEDGPDEQFVVGVTPAGGVYKLARNAADESEFAGATFAPDGSTLFVNLQTLGMTLAIDGPWRAGKSNV